MNAHAISLALSLRADPYPTPDYRVIRTLDDFLDYLPPYPAEHTGPDRILLAEDTESYPDGSPYCLTFSIKPGTGRLIYVSDTKSMQRYRNVLRSYNPHQLFHNYLHDVIQFDKLDLPINKFTDTMVRAYHLCLGGGGDDEDSESKAGRGSLSLKALAYRHCNMTMTSFRDTVYPHSLPYLTNWLDTLVHGLTPLPLIQLCTCTHPRAPHAPRKTGHHTGKCSLCSCKRWSHDKSTGKMTEDEQVFSRLHTKVLNFRNKILDNPSTNWAESDNDPWKKIRNNWEDDIPTLTTFAGPIPTPSIAHVPEPQLLHYACRDADATLRLYLHMLNLKPWVFYE